jgi:hypothetical protein
MDLEDYKAIWAKEQKDLKSRVILNEKRIEEITMGKHKGTFYKLLGISILGRNLALVYMVISIGFAISVIDEFQYSIPALFGAFAMLLSFSQHISLRKPDFINMTTVELQKAINKFRIHTSKYSKYDIAIVSIWLLTLIPIYLKIIFKIDVYSNSTNLIVFSTIVIFLILLTVMFSKNIYQKWNVQLMESEEQLNQIKEFEEK